MRIKRINFVLLILINSFLLFPLSHKAYAQCAAKRQNEVSHNFRQKNLKQLKVWVGKYPVNPESKKFKNFFDVPQVKDILLDLLGAKGLRNLQNHFYGVDLIEEIDGYLVMIGTTKMDNLGNVNYALVALNPKNGETHVRFVDNKHIFGCGNTDAENTLSDEIEHKIEIYAN